MVIGAAIVPNMGMYGILPPAGGTLIGAANVMISGIFVIAEQAIGPGITAKDINLA